VIGYYFTIDDRVIARRYNLMICVATLSILVLMNSEVDMIYGIEVPPYTLSIEAEPVVQDLGDCGVSFVFVPDGRIFCGELKSGKVRVIQDFKMLPEPMIQLDLYHTATKTGRADNRGLTGLTIDPDFERNHYVYLHWTYMNSVDNKTYNRVARFTESDNKLTNMNVILDKIPSTFEHNGGPLEFGPDGKLYITGGAQRKFAQDMSSLMGKIFRINPDGSIPEDNPFPGLPYYTIGHRNSFGIGFHPVTGIPYITENGPTENDEVNILMPGKNYGWPDASSKNNDEMFVKPLLQFTPTIAPTELIFYTGSRYPEEINNMFFLSYNERALYRVVLASPSYDKALSVNSFSFVEQVKGIGSFTDIEQGPDGYLYMSSFKTIMKLIFNFSNVTTTIALDAKSNDNMGNNFELSARIADYFGNPVRDVRIEFFDGSKSIASARSNDEGIALVEYTAERTDQHVFTAEFNGTDMYRTSTSPQRLWTVDDSVSAPVLETLTDDNTKVRLSWNPSQPTPHSPTTFIVEFTDSETNNVLNDVQFDFTIMHGSTILLSKTGQKASEGRSVFEFVFDDQQMGSVQILIDNIDNNDNEAVFTLNVVPEFSASLAMVIMGIVLAVAVIMSYKQLPIRPSYS
jgi:glucose/arabinose dehydrogenase